MQLSVAAANARLDQIEAVIGGPTIQLRTGAPPADCAAAATGSLITEIFGVPNWLEDASGGTKVMRSDVYIANYSMMPGVIGYFRILDGGGVCHMQGTASLPGGGGDMIMENVNVMPDQEVRVLAVTINDNTL
jgi:hypothetical protein